MLSIWNKSFLNIKTIKVGKLKYCRQNKSLKHEKKGITTLFLKLISIY